MYILGNNTGYDYKSNYVFSYTCMFIFKPFIPCNIFSDPLAVTVVLGVDA